jgi:hypothetical protein
MRGVELTAKRLLFASFAVFLSCYVFSSLRLAAGTPVWMDEVLTEWTIRFPAASQVWSALTHGAQASPPAYHLALYYYAVVAGSTPFALRLPSIAAVLVVCGCSFTIFRRHLGAASAVFGSCLLLEILRPYALQIRPYGLVTACFAAALLLWDDLNRQDNSNRQAVTWPRSALIGLLLALAGAFHFYGALFVAALGLAEMIHGFLTKKVRFELWIAMAAAGVSNALWIPFIRAVGQFNPGESGSPAYYARPSLAKLILTYSDLTFPEAAPILLVLTAMMAIVLRPAGSLADSAKPDALRDESGDVYRSDFRAMIVASLLLPVLVFIVSLTVTGTYNSRYGIAAAIGTSALMAGSFGADSFFRRTVPLIAVLAAFLTLTHKPHYFGEFDRSATFQRMPGTFPIVVADAAQFFPLQESAAPDVRSRLVYLTLPPDAIVADRTNEDQIRRWKAINSDLPVQNISTFLEANPKFYVLDTRSSDDAPAGWLLTRHLIELADQVDGVFIYKSRLPPAPSAW